MNIYGTVHLLLCILSQLSVILSVQRRFDEILMKGGTLALDMFVSCIL